jgi:hypothetical protein
LWQRRPLIILVSCLVLAGCIAWLEPDSVLTGFAGCAVASAFAIYSICSLGKRIQRIERLRAWIGKLLVGRR